ncbi:hypothetical protein IR120_00340 [Muribacter muris]|uniref:hypothetical protein n=1 Tax=Muribacter muris TaxID=67855 RepID=UPI00143059EA|nr:hypothetical protein [Muribacter muris]MBF0783928.1 hypothetical protein [Muribacter muris]MBF0826426.1 hypothetical protein [Muribacter muris]
MIKNPLDKAIVFTHSLTRFLCDIASEFNMMIFTITTTIMTIIGKHNAGVRG